MKIGIIITPERNRKKIIMALNEEKIDYTIINLIDNNWLSYFQGQFDGYIIFPPSYPYEWTNIFFKRLYHIEHLIRNKSTPNLDAISIYESKISMHDYFKIHNIPHAKSYTFYNLQDALEYAHNCELPVVVKEDAGSGAEGVKIFKNRKKLLRLVKKSFYFSNQVKNDLSLQGIKSKLYPYKKALDTKREYFPLKSRRRGFIHIQTYKDVKYEWRIIRIGDSYFGHKKIEDKHGYHSGSLNKGWGEIPYYILNLVREVSDRRSLNNMCFDLFETENGELYFNELQAMFGTSTEEQLIVNNVPGRYVYINDSWIFEAGDFTRNGANNLRIKLLKEILENK